MNFQMDYVKVVMQERMEEARQMRLLREAQQRSPISPSRLSQIVSRLFQSNHAPAARNATNPLASPVECQ